MKLILDTHTFIWFINGDKIDDNGFEILPIFFEHTLLVSQMEFHHRDPFDRLIAAQAKSENMTIVSKDKYFEKYDAKVIRKEK